MLGLDVDLRDFYRHAECDLNLQPLARRFRGLKPPRFPSMFECLTNAIACQQLTLTVGIGLLNRLAERYGCTASSASHTFPDPADLAAADPETFRRLGFSTAKGRALVELARARMAGSTSSGFTPSTTTRRPAPSSGSAASAAGRPSTRCCVDSGGSPCSPATTWEHGTTCSASSASQGDAGYDAVRRAVSPWSPYAGLVYFHLLLDHVDRAGWLNDIATSSTHTDVIVTG